MAENNNKRYYKGKSMKGVFHPGDLMVLEKLSIDELVKGDIVVFKEINSAGSEKESVHRIVSIEKYGFVTRGDNNFYNDTNFLTVDNFVGKVAYINREGQKRQVRNGGAGFFIAKFHHLKLYIKKTFWGILRFPYSKLNNTGFIRKLWQPEIVKIHLRTKNGDLIKYIYRNRTVGCVWLKTGKSKFKKPYDLILKNGCQESVVRRKNKSC